MIRPALVFAVGMACLTLPAMAEDNAPPESTGRYSFNRVDDGFLRLDSSTGQVAFCNARAVGWACQAVPEERAALENEIARLTQENVTLKKRLAARSTPPLFGKNEQVGDPQVKLPSDEDLERVVAFMEKAWRRIVEMIVNMQKDMMRKG